MSRRGSTLLALGAGLGVVLAAAGLLASGRETSSRVPADAVARVNGAAIRMADYERTLSALAGDRRDGLSADDRRRALDRLVDEELLVQRGLELDLARQDVRVRRDLTAAVVDAVVAGHEDAEPDRAALAAFYAEHGDFFARPGRVHVRQVWCRIEHDDDEARAAARAGEAAERLRAGEPFATVRDALGDTEVAPLPDAPLPAAKLVDYLGPTTARTALELEPGGVSEPVRSGTGYHVLVVVAREAEWLPPLADIETDVRAEYRRRAGERALRAYLDGLRARADVAIAPAVVP
jgi:parvulin-like peptidyl-prolyl isomerase